MSVDAILARISDLQAMLAGQVPSAVAQDSDATFAAALAGASGAGSAGADAANSFAASVLAQQSGLADTPLGSLATTALGSATGAASPFAAAGVPAAYASLGGVASGYAPAGGVASGYASAGAAALPAGTPYAAEITAAANANGIDPALLAGLVKQESGFDPAAGSHAGARGLTQLMPGTAATLGVTDVLDPVQSLNGGARYLRQQLDAFGGDVTKALAAYNAGPGAVQRFGGVPPYAETQNYVRAVQANAATFRTGSISEI